MLGKLNGEARDPAGAALNEDRLTALELQGRLDSADRGEPGRKAAAAAVVARAVELGVRAVRAAVQPAVRVEWEPTALAGWELMGAAPAERA